MIGISRIYDKGVTRVYFLLALHPKGEKFILYRFTIRQVPLFFGFHFMETSFKFHSKIATWYTQKS